MTKKTFYQVVWVYCGVVGRVECFWVGTPFSTLPFAAIVGKGYCDDNTESQPAAFRENTW